MIPDSVRLPLRELRELGARGTLFRIRWEAGRRLGRRRDSVSRLGACAHTRLALPDVRNSSDASAGLLTPEQRARLSSRVERLQRGELRMFSRWYAPVGTPPRWTVDPVTEHPWHADFRRQTREDVKFVWELGRFPQAWDLVRAASADRERAGDCSNRVRADLSDFRRRCPAGGGVHWASGQEAAIRFVTLWFADAALEAMSQSPVLDGELGPLAVETALVIERDLDYARFAVYNNHLLWEALGLYAAGVCVPDHQRAAHWRSVGRTLLVEQSKRQFYEDGGYIQQSHTYQRMAMQALLVACLVSRTESREPDPEWHAALARSVDFLAAQMNDGDGRLPNYGANDGALPLLLSECDYTDFRPTLTASAVEAGGTRPFDRGPWDEEALWLCGPEALARARLARARPRSRRFDTTGLQVLRGDGGHFGVLRCGTLRDRFSQIDMLHLDLWWRGQNVLVDAGSYRYNGAPEWHNHFMRTAVHNTLTIDGLDQMVHYRQFKCLYSAAATLLMFSGDTGRDMAAGEHHGYARYAGGCVHRRSVLRLEPDVWVIVDHVSGTGLHSVRLHWLGGAFPWADVPDGNGVELRTPAGLFTVHTFDQQASPLRGDIQAGSESPPRGWLSRYYGEKVAVPSFAAVVDGAVPLTVISVLAGCAYELEKTADGYVVRTASGDASLGIRDGVAAFAK